ncbi:MAG: 50S ribosome-binding GTPase [Phycisphaerae bacterium]|nr:50S ribosome-binding GTPase [Phycisphaerae bacterium]
MTDTNLPSALECLAKHGKLLRERFHYDWSSQADEAVHALRFQLRQVRRENEDTRGRRQGRDGSYDRPGGTIGEPGRLPADRRELSLVAIVGGASSGKSTVFNNLVGGRLVSRVTAKGHATMGPIAAVHESHRDAVEQALEAGLLMPSFTPRVGSLDDNTEGEPGILHIVYHSVDALRGVVLLDMPDFTSELARMEGDIALGTLPWFDRLVVLVDHERWFDRQTVGRLRDESSQFGQDRFVVFNRDRDERLDPGQLARLKQQADRLGATDHLVLEFRHGRGCCTFPPGTFDPLTDSLNRYPPQRRRQLVRFLQRLATVVLNNNNERRARLARLREAFETVADRAIPSRAECLTALLTPDERRHFDVISRTLRVTETRQWLARQADRIKQTMRKRLPVFGTLLAPKKPERDSAADTADTADRQTIGWEVFRSRSARQLAAIDEAAAGSDFWTEVRRWTDIEPPRGSPEWIDQRRDTVRSAVETLGKAIEAWTAKVESECRGVSPRLMGAVGAGSIAAAIVLVAVAGPVTALTLPLIKTALAGALGTLATSAGAGAVAGPALTRLLTVIHERLIGSAEFKTVERAMDEYRETIAAFGRDAANRSFAAACGLVVPEDDDLARALTGVCDAAETD